MANVYMRRDVPTLMPSHERRSSAPIPMPPPHLDLTKIYSPASLERPLDRPLRHITPRMRRFGEASKAETPIEMPEVPSPPPVVVVQAAAPTANSYDWLRRRVAEHLLSFGAGVLFAIWFLAARRYALHIGTAVAGLCTLVAAYLYFVPARPESAAPTPMRERSRRSSQASVGGRSVTRARRSASPVRSPSPTRILGLPRRRGNSTPALWAIHPSPTPPSPTAPSISSWTRSASMDVQAHRPPYPTAYPSRPLEIISGDEVTMMD